jgi:hypothetical protein
MQDESLKSTGQTPGDGTTCEPSRPASLMGGSVTSSPEGFLARTCPKPESEPALTASGRDSGLSLPESFASYDPESCLWKTSQGCFIADLAEFSATWPHSGLMRNGTAYRLRRLVPRISARGSSLWPTPTINGNYNRVGASPTSGDGLATVARRFWPSPCATDWKGSSQIGQRRGQLSEAVIRLWPTPRADGRDNCGGSNSRRSAKANGTYIGRKLNPQFVEWLMGFPLGWTDLEPSETPSYRKSPNGSADA